VTKKYKLAEMKQKDCEYFKRIEEQMKMELGKDIVLVAWEKEKQE